MIRFPAFSSTWNLEKDSRSSPGDLSGSSLELLRGIHYEDRQIGNFRRATPRGTARRKGPGDLRRPPGPPWGTGRPGAFTGVKDLSERSLAQGPEDFFIVRLPARGLRGRCPAAGRSIRATLGDLLGVGFATDFGQTCSHARHGFVVFRNGSFLDDEEWISRQDLAYDMKTGEAEARGKPGGSAGLGEISLSVPSGPASFGDQRSSVGKAEK